MSPVRPEMRKCGIAVFLVSALVFLIEPTSAQNSKNSHITTTPLQFWLTVKRQLSAKNGQDYFRDSFKGALVPGGAGGVQVLVGTVISTVPPEQPGVLIVGISDGTTPEVTLRLKDHDGKDAYLNGPIMPGSQIQFEGVPVSFKQDPFMVTFDVSITPRKAVGKLH